MASYLPQGQGLTTGGSPGLSLEGLPVGRSGQVHAVHGGGETALTLMEMGLRPGVEVRVIRHAPLGCPIEIAVGSARFAIRRETARLVKLVPHG